ncbi:ABC transporter ATP-binding protein [Clostridium nigeriense]|uniref:ABC transporter ATP-binding protein n=1 Tax=Clostridium nigeriense TaxID=1805470 RepID=UPI000832AAFD|nr:ABC transporter ATP-binding protein [Clostridium nigeriense]
MELVIKNLNKSYDKGLTYALKDFNVTLTKGIYGLLGPNGAGKSTLMNIITDNLKPSGGEILYNGRNIIDIGEVFRNILGYMPQNQGIYDDFTGEKFLWYMSALKGLSKKQAKEKIEYVLGLVNMEEHKHKKLKSYSGGMKQRILIAQALLNDPEVLILDEPTAGLDPRERIRIRNFISEISLDKIVIIATHVVSDIEFIAKEILLVKKGEIIKKDSPTKLVKEIEDKTFEIEIKDKKDIKEIEKKFIMTNLTNYNNKIFARIVTDKKIEGYEYRSVQPSLEELYLYHFN